MPFLRNADQLRKVEWDRGYLWEVRFPDAPPPFNDFFPATSVAEELCDLVSKVFDGTMNTYQIPTGQAMNEIRLTFVDGGNIKDNQSGLVLSKWITDWINVEILNDEKYISTIETASKLMQVIKLNSQHEIISDVTYWVFPKGKIMYNGKNENSLVEFAVDFAIVG